MTELRMFIQQEADILPNSQRVEECPILEDHANFESCSCLRVIIQKPPPRFPKDLNVPLLHQHHSRDLNVIL